MSNLYLCPCHIAGTGMSPPVWQVLLMEVYATFEGNISPGTNFTALYVPLEIPHLGKLGFSGICHVLYYKACAL